MEARHNTDQDEEVLFSHGIVSFTALSLIWYTNVWQAFLMYDFALTFYYFFKYVKYNFFFFLSNILFHV